MDDPISNARAARDHLAAALDSWPDAGELNGVFSLLSTAYGRLNAWIRLREDEAANPPPLEPGTTFQNVTSGQQFVWDGAQWLQVPPSQKPLS